MVSIEYEKKGRVEYGKKNNIKVKLNEYEVINKLDVNITGVNKQFSKEYVNNNPLY